MRGPMRVLSGDNDQCIKCEEEQTCCGGQSPNRTESALEDSSAAQVASAYQTNGQGGAT